MNQELATRITDASFNRSDEDSIRSLTISQLLSSEKSQFTKSQAPAEPDSYDNSTLLIAAGTAATVTLGVIAWRRFMLSRSEKYFASLADRAKGLQQDLGSTLAYLQNAAGNPDEIIQNSGGLLTGWGRRAKQDIAFKTTNGSWLLPESDGGILHMTRSGDPYVRFFKNGGFETGSNYSMDMAGFFVSPRYSLHQLADGSRIYWKNGILGDLNFVGSQSSKNEPWAKTITQLVDESKTWRLWNFKETVRQGMNLNSGLARELRGSNLEQAFSLVPPGAKPLATGREAFVMKTADNRIARLSRSHTERPADLQEYLLQPDQLQRGTGWQLEIMPNLPKRVYNPRLIGRLEDGLAKKGYYLTDGHPGNIRMLNGKAIVIDPGAINKNRPLTTWEIAKQNLANDLRQIHRFFKIN